MKKIHPLLEPRPGPGGFTIVDIGPDNARIELYANSPKGIYFNCQIFDNKGVRDAVCDDTVSLYDGNVVKFFFPLNRVPYVGDIEAQIRALMEKFRIAGEAK